jgi:hypothetical protein
VNADLRARILEATRAVPAPTREASGRHLQLVVGAAVFLAAGLYFTFDGVRHGQGRPAWFYAASTCAWTASAAFAAWAALTRGRSATGRPKAWLLAVAVGTPAGLFAMMIAFAWLHPELTVLHAERVGFKCLGLALAVGTFPLVALAVLRRGSDPVHPDAAGAALGAACGAAAGALVEFWCPVASVRHVAVGHVLPVVMLALVGWALGSRVIAMRSVRYR